VTEETLVPLERFQAPYGRAVELLEVRYESGMRLLRVRIREGKRFTILELDPSTASHWGGAMQAWAEQAGPADP
jgi:hypothetical protein